ncbi:unnamed protein product [Durusdinium trenchii]|uniref:Uncharacterized protein n=1 Tax=Durusdinium trenchii TaxID=1381693 RepID=A0ABP0QEY8_9DINO
MAPHLVSEKVTNGLRGERRRIEDKCDMKGLTTTMVTITMQPPPASKRVPMVFYGWLCFEEHTSNDNIFMNCSLMADRCARSTLPWAPESNYIVPVAEKDSLPTAAEGSRSFSDVQESAQLLSGKEFPTAILKALLAKAKLPSGLLGIVNTTPYDCCLESVALEWNSHTPAQRMRTLSMADSKSSTTVDYCQKVMAMRLMEDWCYHGGVSTSQTLAFQSKQCCLGIVHCPM